MKIAILNCSDIAKRRIIPAIKKIEGLEITAIVSRTKSRAKEYADLFDIPLYTDSIEEALSTNPDIAYISSPPSEHYLTILACLNSGVNVICEKSLTIDYFNALRLVTLANEKGLIIQENYAFPFHDQWKFITDNLKTIGNLEYIRSGFEFPPRDKKTDFRYDPSLGGGALFDAGGYPIKVATLLLNSLSSGNGVIKIDPELRVDISGNFHIIDVDMKSAFLTWSFEAPYRCDLEIIGTGGKIVSNKIFTPRADESVKVDITDLSGKVIESKEFVCDHFEMLIRDFIKRIKTKNSSHHEEIINQSKMQIYAKTTCIRTFTN